MRLKWLIISLFSLGTSVSGQSYSVEQDYYTRFGHLTVSDGLPGNHITVIRQDTEKFQWIGTREGLTRFDGTRFHSFRHIPGDSTTVPSDYINDILISSTKQVFIATKQGLAVFLSETAGFQQVPTLYEDGYGLQDKHIRALANADDTHIWVETFDGTLHLLNTLSFKAEIWSHEAPTQPYYDYHALLQDTDSILWIGGRNMGPLKWEKGKITAIQTNPDNPLKKRDRDVAFFFEDSNKDFWMGGLDGLYQYQRDKDIFHKRIATSSYQMTESANGILWVATGKGFARIDKANQKITLFLASENDPSSIIHDHINCVSTDSDGNIWIGTSRGISILSPVQNLIHHYRHLAGLKKSLSHNHVSSFLEDHSGDLWIGTRGGGLNRFKSATSQFEIFDATTPNKSSISSNQVSALHQHEDATMWIGLWRGIGFNRFDPQKNQFQRFALDSTSLKKDWYAGIQSWGSDTLVVGFWGAEGIRLFHKKEKRWLPHNFRPVYHPTDHNLTKILATDTLVWLYQSGGIIRSFHLKTKQYSAYRSNAHNRNNHFHKIRSVSLPDFSILHQMVFHQGMTLFLTDKGLAGYDHQTDKFSFLNPRVFLKAAQRGDTLLLLSHHGIYDFDHRSQKIRKVSSINRLPLEPSLFTDLILLEGDRLMLTSDEGIHLFDIKTGSPIPVTDPFEAINKSGHQIKKIRLGSKNAFLMALERGIAYLSSSGELSYYNTTNAYSAGLKNDAIRDICYCPKAKGFWINTDRGLFFFNPRNQEFNTIQDLSESKINQAALAGNQLFLATDQGLASVSPKNHAVTFFNQPPADMLSSHLTTFVKKDKDGHIWAGTTNKGINRIDRHTLKIAHFYPGNGFHGSEALAFLETSDGTVYAGGDSLNIFNPEKGTFDLAPIAHQLPHGKIQSLIEDHLGRILIITVHHISIFDPETNSIFDLTPFLETDNLTFTSASLKTSANEIYIGTLNGFFRFNPALLTPEIKQQETRIVRIMVGGEVRQRPSETHSPLRLKHNENFVGFYFSDMQYPSFHDHYKYMLSGIDTDWIHTGEASANYKMLSPGNYIFKVQKINPFGGSTVASFPFTILPPFWLSGWFIILVLLILTSAIFTWWSYRIKHLRLMENNLALQQRLLLSQMNPHFLFNALSAIQAFIFQNQPHTAGSYLAKFAKLMRLYLNNMAQPFIDISDEVATLNHYLELQKLRFNNTFNYSVQISGNIGQASTGLPTMMVQPFVENAVEHGIRELEWQGWIEVVFSLQKHTWEIFIRDNGTGIEENKSRQSASPLQRKSMSTGITKKRIAQLQKQFKYPCSLQITDLSRQPGSETGTEVRLVVPAINMGKASSTKKRNKPRKTKH